MIDPGSLHCHHCNAHYDKDSDGVENRMELYGFGWAKNRMELEWAKHGMDYGD